MYLINVVRTGYSISKLVRVIGFEEDRHLLPPPLGSSILAPPAIHESTPI
jgi:hypothetical protein